MKIYVIINQLFIFLIIDLCPLL